MEARLDDGDSDPRLMVVVERSIDLLSKFVIPLYTNDRRGRPMQFGSGFFVRRGRDRFLISAAHVLREALSNECYYYIQPGLTCRLSGTLVSGWMAPGVKDNIDVAGLLLGESSELPSPELEKYCVDESYIVPRYAPREGRQYVIIGYPASRNRSRPHDRTVTAQPYAYYADSIPSERYSSLGLSPETHVAIPLDLKVGYGADGKHRNLPRPQGMSGSPIWALLEEPTNAAHRTFPLVGVGTTYLASERVLVGTDSGIIDEIFRVAI